MKKYYYSDGTNSFGPFSFEELKMTQITPITYIWFEGLTNWTKAMDVPELQELFIIPPPIQEQHFSTTITDSQTIRRKRPLDILIVISLAYWLLMDFVNYIFFRFYYNWYESPVRYFKAAMGLIFAIVPFVFAFSIKDDSLRKIALVVSFFYINVYSLQQY